jgi:DNA (cytosine-5-)-methyltransferase
MSQLIEQGWMVDKEKITLATLFSGIGVAELAACEVYDKVEITFACELDKFARLSYLANHEIDEARFFADAKELDARPYAGRIDILVGGSPCQDFSIAGARAGTEGDRGNLIWQYYRVVKECRPEVFVFENVRGFLSIEKGRAYVNFINALRDLGYHCHAEILNTKDYGVPQNRERLYIVGFLDADRYFSFRFAPKRPLKLTLGDMLEPEVDEKYFLSERAIAGMRRKNPKFSGQFRPISDFGGVSNTLISNPGYRRTDTFIKIAGELNLNAKDANKRVYDIDGIAPTLTARSGGQTEPKILQRARSFNKGGEFELCPTISSDSFAQNNPLCGERIRKLTPRECLRLQGIGDDFKVVVSDTQLYKQAGNAMSQNVVEMILEQVELAKNKEFILRATKEIEPKNMNFPTTNSKVKRERMSQISIQNKLIE